MSDKNIQAADFNIDSSFRHWPGDAAEDRAGPFFSRFNETGIESRFRSSPDNANMFGQVHGGVLMTFADYTLCMAACCDPDSGEMTPLVTVSMNSEFVSSAQAGDLVCGQASITRRGGSLVFVRGQLSVEDRVVMSCSAVLKLIRQR